MPLETEINVAHVYKKNKCNMPAHMYLNAHAHTQNMNNKVKHSNINCQENSGFQSQWNENINPSSA